MSDNYSVSVIICCYSLERLNDLLQAIDSVKKQTVKPREIIIIVDHSPELFKKLKTVLTGEIKLFFSDGITGLSEARNYGIRQAKSNIIAFLDDDAVAEIEWLERLSLPFDNPLVMAVGGEALPAWPGGKAPFWFPLEFDFVVGCTNHKKLIIQNNTEVRNVTGSNMAFRKEVFDLVGGWETKLGRNETGKAVFNPSGGEEAELCLRIKNLIPGSLIVFAPDAVIHHKVSPERIKLKYVFGYSFREGVTRAMVKNIAFKYGRKPLAAENLYVNRLLRKTVPYNILNFYKLAPLAQTGVLFANLSLVLFGYIVGNQKYKRF